MEIILFGVLADITGGSKFDPEGITSTDQLKQKLLLLYPSISKIPYAIAVNNEIIRSNHSLEKNDLVSLLPPFSGG